MTLQTIWRNNNFPIKSLYCRVIMGNALIRATPFKKDGWFADRFSKNHFRDAAFYIITIDEIIITFGGIATCSLRTWGNINGFICFDQKSKRKTSNEKYKEYKKFFHGATRKISSV